MDVGGPVGTGDELHQEGRLVARATRRVEEDLLRCRSQEGRCRPVDHFWPRDAPEMSVAVLGEQREAEPAEPFEPYRAELGEAGDRGRTEVVFGNRGRHVAGLSLHRFLAHLGEMAGLVDHPALLAAHAERAGLAGVARAQPAIEWHDATRLAPLAEHVTDRGETTPAANPQPSHGRRG